MFKVFKFKVSPVLRQFVTIISYCILTCRGSGVMLPLSFSMLYGWAPVNSSDLQWANSTLPIEALSKYETSLVISLVNVGAFIGNFGVVPIIYMIGPKRTIHLFAIPLILSSLLIVMAQNVYYLYISRILTGFVGGALPVAIPSLINDICFDNVRGALSSLYDISLNIGLIVSFFLGSHLNASDQSKAYLIVPIVFIVVLFFFPESPEFLVKRGKEKQAKKSFEFYKGDAIESENGISNQNVAFDEIQKNKLDKSANVPEFSLKDFATPQAKKACFIAFTTYILCFLCGIYVLLNYMNDIFTETGSYLSPKSSSFMVSITTLVGNFVFFSIVERFDRRFLFITSAFLTASSYFLFATYCSLWINLPEYEWMPPVCIACIIFISYIGLMPIPYIIAIEIFPKEIRAVGLAISLSIMWVMLFVGTAVFPILLQYIGLSGCMIILGVMCLVNAIFGILFIPETRGKSNKEIMDMLSK